MAWTRCACCCGSPLHLSENGVLIVEVGNTETRVRRAFPRLPFVWLSFARGGGGVFLLTAAALVRGGCTAVEGPDGVW